MKKFLDNMLNASFLVATLALLAILYVISMAYLLIPVALVGVLAYWLIYC